MMGGVRRTGDTICRISAAFLQQLRGLSAWRKTLRKGGLCQFAGLDTITFLH